MYYYQNGDVNKKKRNHAKTKEKTGNGDRSSLCIKVVCVSASLRSTTTCFIGRLGPRLSQLLLWSGQPSYSTCGPTNQHLCSTIMASRSQQQQVSSCSSTSNSFIFSFSLPRLQWFSYRFSSSFIFLEPFLFQFFSSKTPVISDLCKV